jgi:integrase
MKGHIRRRGVDSWEIKFDLGRDPLTKKRRVKYVSFRGKKREAENEKTRLLAEASQGLIAPSGKITVGGLLDRWLNEWAVDSLGAKTRERHAELIEKHIRPHIGAHNAAKLLPADLKALYSRLVRRDDNAAGVLSPRTVLHVHRILHRAFKLGCKYGVVARNPAGVMDKTDRPAIKHDEVQILPPENRKPLLDGLKGSALYLPVLVALTTGARRGEILALTWEDVDFAKGTLRIVKAIEATKRRRTVKSTKTKYGRRTIKLPAVTLEALRAERARHNEQRLALGLGKAETALIFPNWEAEVTPEAPFGFTLRSPAGLTKEWGRKVAGLGLPKLTFHALRHTHASELIAGGVDIVAISRRLGHSNPSVTLSIYAHLYGDGDDKAARVVDRGFEAGGLGA